MAKELEKAVAKVGEDVVEVESAVGRMATAAAKAAAHPPAQPSTPANKPTKKRNWLAVAATVLGTALLCGCCGYLSRDVEIGLRCKAKAEVNALTPSTELLEARQKAEKAKKELAQLRADWNALSKAFEDEKKANALKTADDARKAELRKRLDDLKEIEVARMVAKLQEDNRVARRQLEEAMAKLELEKTKQAALTPPTPAPVPTPAPAFKPATPTPTATKPSLDEAKAFIEALGRQTKGGGYSKATNIVVVRREGRCADIDAFAKAAKEMMGETSAPRAEADQPTPKPTTELEKTRKENLQGRIKELKSELKSKEEALVLAKIRLKGSWGMNRDYVCVPQVNQLATEVDLLKAELGMRLADLQE